MSEAKAIEIEETIMPEQDDSEEVQEEVEVQDKKDSKPEKINVQDLDGVGPATAEKLSLAGFDTVIAIAVATPGELVDASGVTESTARKIIQSSRSCMEMGFESGIEVMEKRKRVMKIHTGSEAFDTLMSGGFETSSITEVFAEFGAGKTQIAHLLCVNIQKEDPNAVAVYIDTENTFRPERIRQFAEGQDLDPDKVLANIKVARAYNSDHQMLLVDKVDELINKENLNVKLVIVDSLTAHFRAEFVGRGTLAERQQKLNKHMHALLKLADMHNVCVYVTNQVMAKPDQFFGDPTTAIGGHIVGHASTFRIYLRKGKKGSRVAKLIDAPHLPDGECGFYVTESGLKDLKG
ncbi:DNA repair and recombination protein RadA [Nanoarchaeota archaeon]